jgi:hypothetical protein
MTDLFFCLLNVAEEECKILKHRLRKVLASVIRIKFIGVCFKKCIDNSKRARTKSVMPFADALIHLEHATGYKRDSLLDTLV